MNKSLCFLAAFLGLFHISICASPEDGDKSIGDLKKLTVEELMDIEIITVSKQYQKLVHSASAVQVITAGDIMRSGASTLAEVLRLAANLQVAQVNSHDWAISSRGFNGAPVRSGGLSDKLLVLRDGRSIYSSLYGGMNWDTQQYLLENIERIEVVSGPGGTLWGSNAVNGVINIITKKASVTQGMLSTASYGEPFGNQYSFRYGGKVAEDWYARIYGQRLNREGIKSASGEDYDDKWNQTQFGFRMDKDASWQDTYTWQGDFYSGNNYRPDTLIVNGQNFLARWTHTFFDGSVIKFQSYYDRIFRDIQGDGFNVEIRSYDFDVSHAFQFGQRNNIIWGGNFRIIDDMLKNDKGRGFKPEAKTYSNSSAFVQDEFAFVPEKLKLTLGTKLENKNYSGLEIQPNARLAYIPKENITLWSAISRAVRTPSRFDVDLYYPLVGLKNESEKLIAYEAGLRWQWNKMFSFSPSFFYNQYDDVRTVNLKYVTVDTNKVPKYTFESDQEGSTWGVELNTNIQLSAWWRLNAGCSFLQKDLRLTDTNAVPFSLELEGMDPDYQLKLHSMMDLPWNLQLNGTARLIDGLPRYQAEPRVRGYFNYDLQLLWAVKRFEFSLVGRNLWDDQQPEFGSLEVPRTWFGKVAWRL